MVNEIKEDNEDRVNLFFEHGLDINVQLTAAEHLKRTPIHIAALNGSLNSLLAMIS